MPLLEKFTDMILIEEQTDGKTQVDKAFIKLIVIITIRLLLLYIVFILWPKVMPVLFKGVKSNPTFLQLIGLSVIIALI